MTVDVIQVMRRSQNNSNFSIEGLFATVRAHLPADVRATVETAPHVSRGLRRRASNSMWARRWRRHTVHVTGDILYVTPFLGPRTVITFHDVGWVRHGGIRQQAFNFLWCSLPSRRARIITTVSEFTRSALLRIVPEAEPKIRVVPNCVDPAFSAAPERGPAEEPIVLFVGTTANKNLERFALALQGITCQLHVIGPLSESQRQALTRNRVHWRNSVGLSVRAMVDAYVAADVVALPSTYEGFGMPIIEAQAVGRPVMTSRVASMPEVAADAAVLADPFDVASMRAGLVSLIENPGLRAQLRRRGFENVRRFEPHRVAGLYADAYRAAAAGGSA